VGGSNGEFTYLTVEERVQMVRRVRELAADDKLVIAGAGCECQYCNVSVCLICCCLSLRHHCLYAHTSAVI